MLPAFHAAAADVAPALLCFLRDSAIFDKPERRCHCRAGAACRAMLYSLRCRHATITLIIYAYYLPPLLLRSPRYLPFRLRHCAAFHFQPPLIAIFSIFHTCAICATALRAMRYYDAVTTILRHAAVCLARHTILRCWFRELPFYEYAMRRVTR